MFVLNSEISIGKLKFSGVNNVTIRKSIFSLVDMATIVIPSIAKVLRNGKADSSRVVTGAQFREGDEVTILLGYNGDLRTEFKGFVKRININMPMVIECEGYSWLMRRSNVNVFEQSITLKDLLKRLTNEIESPYKIDVICDVDVSMSNVHLGNMNVLQALEKTVRYTDGAITCFFIQPDTLWCGKLYTAYAKGRGIANTGNVSYRPGYNALKENTLDIRIASDNTAEVTYCKKNSAGSVLIATASLLL